MPWREVLDLYDLLDDSAASGEGVAAWLRKNGVDDVRVTTVQGNKGSTDFVRAVIPGSRGRTVGGDAPTLG
jgi:hypothetical protein